MKISVKTLFDCSVTGTTGNFRPSQIPFRDQTNALVQDQLGWTRSRNRQRNWETLLQVLSLRTQIENITPSLRVGKHWCFSFDIDNPAVYGNNGDLSLLIQDCRGVPMVHGIEHEQTEMRALEAAGPDQNIWFQTINT